MAQQLKDKNGSWQQGSRAVCLFLHKEGEIGACLSLQNMENLFTEDGRSKLIDTVKRTFRDKV